jgi:hypothetical protein
MSPTAVLFYTLPYTTKYEILQPLAFIVTVWKFNDSDLKPEIEKQIYWTE